METLPVSGMVKKHEHTMKVIGKTTKNLHKEKLPLVLSGWGLECSSWGNGEGNLGSEKHWKKSLEK